MLQIALKMLLGDRPKFAGLIFGISFTSFLVTFAGSYFAGFITRGFAIISENPGADVWIMDPAVESADRTINLPASALERVRGVDGVAFAYPLVIATANARFPNGRFQSFQIVGVDGATLMGLPRLQDGIGAAALRAPDAVAIDPGGTSGKLQTPTSPGDQWPYGPPRLDVPTRSLAVGDVLRVNDRRVIVMARAHALPRYPPRPLMYTTVSNAVRILPPERHRLTFVIAKTAVGVDPRVLAARIETRTGLKARSADDFKLDTVTWLLRNSEDVGDMAAMMSIAVLVGFGVTAVLLYLFTSDALRQYAVLKAMGATPRLLLTMIFTQAGLCALLGTGLGLGVCAVVGQVLISAFGYPFRMMWFAPTIGGVMVLLVSIVAAAISARPVLRLEPAIVFAGR